METVLLELKNISKKYENKPLLRHISFFVRKGETICLLGASGSGKSTLLRMIAGLESPDEGSILFNGIDLASTPPHIRDFGLVFQDYALFPHLNVFENIAFGLKMQNLPTAKIQERVVTLLNQVNLSGYENRKVTELSGGEQQRVALARALAPQPRLLMFDEPLGALDRTLKENLLNEIRDILHKAKIPAIYVTHDQEEAFTIADRILLLHDAEIVQSDRPEKIWDSPKLAWVAQFLGVGTVIQGQVDVKGKVKMDYGEFILRCKHKHRTGETVRVLIRGAVDSREQIKIKVEDVLFKRDQFEVRGRGGFVFQLKEKPKIGQLLHIRVKVECLHEDSKEKSCG